jgi:DNA-binding transcriptional LysR family regulator
VSFSWDDIAVLLAIHRERTTGRAAAALGCSQPTVVRRIAALEAATGLTLFERSSSGFEPTEAALALIPAAEAMELAVFDLEAEICSHRGDAAQTVCLTLLDHFEVLFVPILRQFRVRWPDVRVELLASDRIYDLARGEADIAIRGRSLPGDDAIVCHQLPDCAWTLYASSDLPEHERPSDWDGARHHVLAFPDGAPGRLPIYQKLAEVALDGSGTLRCSNYNAMRSLIVSGTALSALPVTVGDSHASLVRCFPPPPEFDVPIFLLARRTSLRRPYMRDLFDRISGYFDANPGLLTGRA